MPDTPSESICESICQTCGYPAAAEPCERCHGDAVSRPSGRAIRPGRRFFLFDLAHGFSSLFRSALRLVHRREFVGQLTLPILANIAAMTIAFIAFYFGIWSFFDWLTAADWGWLEFLHGIGSWATEISFRSYPCE